MTRIDPSPREQLLARWSDPNTPPTSDAVALHCCICRVFSRWVSPPADDSVYVGSCCAAGGAE